MTPHRYQPRLILRVPNRITAAHPSTYPNGVLWGAWEAADASLSEHARRRRYWTREYRDAYREAFGLPTDPVLVDSCSRAIARVVGLVRAAAPTEDIGAAADAAAEIILTAIASDPDGAPDFVDLLEAVADTLTARPDCQFCVPQVLTALALVLACDGEPEAGMALLDCTIRELDKLQSAGADPVLVARNLALGYCAKSDLYAAAGDQEARLLAVKAAWDWAALAHADCQCFVVDRYRIVLQEQGHPPAVVDAALRLSTMKREEAGPIDDWLFLNWPEA